MDVATRFDKVHAQFNKIMESAERNRNIYANCVSNEGRKSELTSIFVKLEAI